MATRLYGHRVTVSLENSALVLRIDGKIASGPLPPMSSGAIRLDPHGDH